MMERHPVALDPESQTYHKGFPIRCGDKITMTDSLYMLFITTQIPVGKYRILRIRFKWSIRIFWPCISYHMAIFRTTFCNHEIIPVPKMIHMRWFNITAAASLPDRSAFCQTFSGCDIDLTLENTASSIWFIRSIADKINFVSFKIQRRINTALIHKNGIRPFAVDIVCIDIKIFLIGIVVGNHIEPSVMEADRRCEHPAGTGNLI